MDCNKANCMKCKFGGQSDGCHFDEESYNQALTDLKFNLEEEKKAYAHNGHSLDTDKWLDNYIKSKLSL